MKENMTWGESLSLCELEVQKLREKLLRFPPLFPSHRRHRTASLAELDRVEELIENTRERLRVIVQ